VVEPGDTAKEPVGHSKHAELPASNESLPAGQYWQVEETFVEAKLPGLHDRQTVAFTFVE